MAQQCPWMLTDGSQRKQSMMALAKELFPIHRTLINRGYDRSLEIIQQALPLDVTEYPSGTAVWDWTVPNAWDVNEAYVEDSQGRRLIDFADSNLHLSAYSLPFDGEVTRDELLEHLAWIESQPDAIPYGYLYYQRDWQFNIAYRDLERFTDDRYRVRIDVDERPGALKVGCCYLPGSSEQEVLFSTYLCHPSLANDNLSGVVVAVELFKALSQLKDRRCSYRLLILPETIGAITWLAHHGDLFENIVGGYVVYDCGDPGSVTYKRSYCQDAVVDRAAAHVLKHYSHDASVRPWHPSGSDERQYNAPGVRIPTGSFMRTPAGEFSQYHTSLDTLDVLSPDALLDSVQMLYDIAEVIDSNIVPVNLYKGEPCFSKYNITYPSFREDQHDESRYLVKKMIYEFDGTQSLLDIADKLDTPFDQIQFLADQFHSVGLIRPI
jgi:aminopeptidase-like protein